MSLVALILSLSHFYRRALSVGSLLVTLEAEGKREKESWTRHSFPCARRIILETDPTAIASRVSRPKADAGVNLSEITINEQTIMQVNHPRSFPFPARRLSPGTLSLVCRIKYNERERETDKGWTT